ncbi:MAG TPA: hypothetical protein VK558_07140, partial [Patescibacteria group bacterium]|nr:hypothetical protein [Patescibacteria group bacterium]
MIVIPSERDRTKVRERESRDLEFGPAATRGFFVGTCHGFKRMATDQKQTAEAPTPRDHDG